MLEIIYVDIETILSPELIVWHMNYENDFFLKPGMGVDLVFNLDSLSPTSKSSIVFDCDESRRQIIVAQPVHRIHKDNQFNQMHISSLVKKELSTKIRLGYSCKIIDIIREYSLSNHGKSEAIVLEYFPPAMEINIRAAFRFRPNSNFDVYGKLVINDEMYYSGRHFKFHDISITGIGILIPKKILKERNPLLDLKTNSHAKIGILLKTGGREESASTIECDINVVRTNMEYNLVSGFAGCSMINLTHDSEETLNRFIHNAQLHEIRKVNRFK